MKNGLLKFSCIFIAASIISVLFAGGSGTIFAQAAVPGSITGNFGKDPETAHNFTWVTASIIKNGIIEYCEKDQFKDFNGSNIIRITAQSYMVKTDLDQRVIHKVELVNLKPGTEYVYRVGSTGGYSPKGVFRTAGQETNGFTFINITDTQGTVSRDYAIWKNTLGKALRKLPSARFLIHTGDMVDEGQKINQWDLFTNSAESELLNLPIEPVVGNHEMLDSNKTNYNARNFTNAFDLPGEQDTGAPSGTVYSFDYGDAHIAVMNTQCGSSNLKKQADWLRRDLKSTNKPWKIVALHRGPYGATYDTTDIRKAWVPVFDELGVNLVLEGHDHNYMRSYPIKGGARVKAGKGTLYIVSNTGGVKFYPQKARGWQAVDLQPYTQMYVAVTVQRSEMAIKAYDVNNQLRDSVTLLK